MKCPICQQEMFEVYVAPHSEGFTVPTGYNCPTQNDLPFGARTPHLTIRGYNTIVTLYPYRISNWEMPDSKGATTLYHYVADQEKPSQAGRFTEVAKLPLVKLDTEEKMLKKLSIYALFS